MQCPNSTGHQSLSIQFGILLASKTCQPTPPGAVVENSNCGKWTGGLIEEWGVQEALSLWSLDKGYSQQQSPTAKAQIVFD